MDTLLVPVDARAPYGFVVLLTRQVGDLAPLDFTTVTACTLEVYKNDQRVGDWSTVLSAQTTTTATATRVCSADGSDFPNSQQLRIRPVVTLPSGQRFCASFLIQPQR